MPVPKRVFYNKFHGKMFEWEPEPKGQNIECVVIPKAEIDRLSKEHQELNDSDDPTGDIVSSYYRILELLGVDDSEQNHKKHG